MPSISSEEKDLFTIAFYNLENLFDTINDPKTLDDDFTANSTNHWNKKRLNNKIQKLSRVISQIGFEEIGYPPVLLGVAEVENRAVLELLTESKLLKHKNYGIIHFDSPDERGIDTGLLYRKEFFKVVDQHVHEVFVTNEHGERDYTRDILHVEGELQGEPLHLLVNHWPSRRSGTQETSEKRMTVAKINREIIEKIQRESPEKRILVMGDFNDDPFSASVQHLTSDQLYNPMATLLSNEEGSLNHDHTWHLFDQILITPNFLAMHENRFRFEHAGIFNPSSIKTFKGPFQGLPFRTFGGRKYLGGYSDHFPVYSIFSIKS